MNTLSDIKDTDTLFYIVSNLNKVRGPFLRYRMPRTEGGNIEVIPFEGSHEDRLYYNPKTTVAATKAEANEKLAKRFEEQAASLIAKAANLRAAQ